jgi:hypothetical protein
LQVEGTGQTQKLSGRLTVKINPQVHLRNISAPRSWRRNSQGAAHLCPQTGTEWP